MVWEGRSREAPPYPDQRTSAFDVLGLGGEAEEAFDGEADVGGAHQGLADEDGGDAGGFEALDVAAGADAALADER